eukprot:Nitzschia sp. Nitz4//scaffold29_size155292//21282//23097//NITZ4_002638-RA/size155292-augustus-gene-0.219-mRNA-1//-1//CDS//3329546388//7838//frame0
MAEKGKRKGSSDVSKSSKKPKVDDSKSSSAQKRQLRKERQSHRRHADIVADAKVLWNKLRLKSNTPDDTKQLMKEVMTLIQGKVNEIALQHDASRVVQAAIQFGNEEQRRILLDEICAESAAGLSELAKIQYAHFCCLKFIKYCARDEASVRTIVKSFKGSISKLAVHAVGARVLESLFLNLPAKATLPLKQELYGPHFSLFALNMAEAPTLQKSLEIAKTDTQKEAAISFVKELVSKGMTKNFYGYTFFQELLSEYMEVADAGEIRTLTSSIADHSIHLLSTRAGTKVVATCATYGSPKDRKRICKSLKGYAASTLLHRDAYLALLQIVQVTDDTVSINKTILNEIVTAPKSEDDDKKGSPLLDLLLSETASKLFLMVLVEDDEARRKYFDPYERQVLKEDATMKENGKEVPTSKKDPVIRRQETLQNLKGTLEETCVTNAEQLITSLPGSRVLKEVYHAIGTSALVDAILEVCAVPTKEGESVSVFEDPIGHRTIKNLILCDIERKEPLFADRFVEKFADQLKEIGSTNRGAFVVEALFKVPSLKSKLSKALKPAKKHFQKLAKGEGATAGFEAVSKLLS